MSFPAKKRFQTVMVWTFSKPYFCRKECHAKNFCVRKTSVDTLHFANVIF